MIKKNNFKKWEKEVSEKHLEREYKGLFDDTLHYETLLKVIKEKEVADKMVDEFGLNEYENKILQLKKSLDTKTTELEALKRIYK